MKRKTYFIADTHFGHEDIIAYEKRPFQSIEEMDQTMMDRWNKVVGKEDEIFVLGDFSFYNKEKTIEICKRLNGTKILIMGNHEIERTSYHIECGFQQAVPYPIIFEEFWILSHAPLYINQNMPYANIYGHVHANPIYADASKQSFCACVERIEYTPILFEDIKKAMGIKVE